ncbi:tRNA (adenosine(37)-N6)-dimethylallyltransferase MiaA [Neorhizobium galegae]|uniref:tRNA (adenosine(37)-N6)-dimethylallyltransferase MiaA n=1 Tax=Neorhizobium galegae TaxID=399 RepID=UPI0006214028|nr:tRNA (adenosine(37)-N6)-dimethylallyltransferase MiaA [Neorhizobium galegae]CDZ61529.1 TRNA dimethylallyltransferase [Neorhizobium galegae bv. orientalis]KAB1124960.1 tRNA (adenosine(37)-N6)-dimethylallyltransferase MiaA [Neorhizobium galegae]MCQ1809813.1 tRNA (adenosine(37)-N6)-dimethylallyltransferase MiaA [Neorhizobium galegae]MCQ1836546.1 tRNA (adenosine(37)-N6)-dimethylallyltransferase MiaA [Neorhizobium galegae]UIK03474.1 tRNA (adenosine(37)-N6)-dimethylallyltransferase MiaA [Neorhizo
MSDLIENFDAILITGPTASGKSALALRLARETNGVVINADSMQVYDTLRVLTARPAEDEMDGVPHLLYGHVPATRAYSTGEWLRDVAALLPELAREGRLPVFVGGTGLYFKALTGGLSDMPEISQEIRCEVRLRLKEEGPEALHAELSARDAAVAASLEPKDGQRIVRALEVLAETGRSIAEFQGRQGPMVIDPSRAKKLVVLPDRKLLHERIDRRFETMLESGAVDEVRALLALGPAPDLPVMKAIGVAQIAEMRENRMSREEVIERGSALTRQYAKRQMTWFRNQMDESWERLA